MKIKLKLNFKIVFMVYVFLSSTNINSVEKREINISLVSLYSEQHLRFQRFMLQFFALDKNSDETINPKDLIDEELFNRCIDKTKKTPDGKLLLRQFANKWQTHTNVETPYYFRYLLLHVAINPIIYVWKTHMKSMSSRKDEVLNGEPSSFTEALQEAQRTLDEYGNDIERINTWWANLLLFLTAGRDPTQIPFDLIKKGCEIDPFFQQLKLL